jgi:hypothetical protein
MSAGNYSIPALDGIFSEVLASIQFFQYPVMLQYDYQTRSFIDPQSFHNHSEVFPCRPEKAPSFLRQADHRIGQKDGIE